MILIYPIDFSGRKELWRTILIDTFVPTLNLEGAESEANRKSQIALILSLVILVSCSRGKVIDHNTESFKAAKIELFKFPNAAATSPTTAWQTSYAYQYYTESQTSNWDGYNYGWDQISGSTCGDFVGNSSLPVQRWYRLRVGPLSGSAYEPYVTYLYHDTRDESCTTYNCDTSTETSQSCFSFPEVRQHPKDPTQTYPAKHQPDILPDLRNLAAAEVECAWEDTIGSVPDAVGLIFDVGIANTGSGQLRVETPLPGDSCSGSASCPLGLTCVSSVCEYATCVSDTDCAGSLVCNSGTCALDTCSTSDPCDDGPGCVYDGFCPETYPSSEGEQPCTTNADCFDTEECLPSGGTTACFARSCVQNSDCASNHCWIDEGKCIPAPAACNANSTECVCELGSTGTCAAATYQVVVGLSGNNWSYPLPEEFVDTALGRETPQMLAVSGYFATSGCIDTDFGDRDATWLTNCNLSMDSPGVDSMCLQSSLATRQLFDNTVSNEWGNTRPSYQCEYASQNIMAGDKTLVSTDDVSSVLVLDRRSVHSTFSRLTSLSNDYVYVEAFFDPNEIMPLDRTRENNIARAKIRLPVFPGPASVNWDSYCDVNTECNNHFSTGRCKQYFGGTP